MSATGRTFSSFWSSLIVVLVVALLAGCSTKGEGKAEAEQAKEAEVAKSGGGAGGSDGGNPEGGGSGDGSGGGAQEETAEEAPDPASVGANEAGFVMVLEYHRVGGDPYFAPEWTISTEEMRRELEYLYENDYFPVNFRDLLRGTMDVPAGKTPVVLTFDDSSDTQFTMVREGGEWVPDPHGAVGVLTDFHREHPDWPLRATFFVLPAADPPNNLFGQPELEEEKLRFLVENGMEVGTHTLWHADLGISTPPRAGPGAAGPLHRRDQRAPPGLRGGQFLGPVRVLPAEREPSAVRKLARAQLRARRGRRRGGGRELPAVGPPLRPLPRPPHPDRDAGVAEPGRVPVL